MVTEARPPSPAPWGPGKHPRYLEQRMAKVNVLVLRAAGTNCDEETAFAFELAGAEAQRVHVNRLRETPALLRRYEVLAIPGGFTYGDDLGAGTVLANELTCWLRDQLEAFLQAGRLIIGICNGFQVLVKMDLLPRVPGLDGQRQATLAPNLSARFEDRWVRLRVTAGRSAFVRDQHLIELPVAHAEGRFAARDDAVLEQLKANNQIVFQYCDTDGRPTTEYPANPNGSVLGVAGVCDPTGRVLGMMPHPERHVLGVHHPRWTREGAKAQGDGLALFKNALAYFA